MGGRRIFWCDFLKTFGICLVVWGHFLPKCWIKIFIYSFHVPMFFIVSGFINQTIHDGARQIRLRRLLLPYLVWTTISVIAYAIAGRTASETMSLRHIACSFVPVSGFGCWNSPLWFLYALFVVEAITPAIADIEAILKGRFSESWTNCLAFASFYIVCIIVDFVLGYNLLAYKQIYLGSVFYLIGAVLCRYRLLEKFSEYTWISYASLAIGLCCGVLNGSLSIYVWHIRSVVLLAISAIGVTLFLINISVKFVGHLCAVRRFTEIMGRCTMPILCSHFFFVYAWWRDCPAKYSQNAFAATGATMLVLASYAFYAFCESHWKYSRKLKESRKF